MTTGRSELKWYKSSYSTNDGPECVEVAAASHTVHIRDSKNIDGPLLGFTPDHWTAFVTFAVASSPS
ncbi:DUF397 domain-containing protein [Streptomyces sp. NPDC005195]|uniref:DUF397 domain-containing protein n=1 Tax=Streptomyces sp. NPDC005195 TaxID=3154561 RepID=UPI0033AB2E72